MKIDREGQGRVEMKEEHDARILNNKYFFFKNQQKGRKQKKTKEQRRGDLSNKLYTLRERK